MADTLTTVRPSGGSGATSVVGAANEYAATSDNTLPAHTDGSYYQSTIVGSSVGLSFPAVTLPAGAVVKSITPRIRWSSSYAESGAGYTPKLYFQFNIGGEVSLWDSFPIPYAGYPGPGHANIYDGTGVVRPQRPGGGPWTQADLNALTLFTNATQPNYVGSYNVRVYELYLDVAYNQAPVAVVTAPTGTPALARPTVTWTYSDPEGDAQDRYRVKIFTAAQYGIGGFDPEVSPNTWDSGEVFGSALTQVIGTDLFNGVTYKAYVKVADVGSNGRYSAWAVGAAWTITVTAPPVPTLVITADNVNNRMIIGITSGAFATAQRAIVERSLDVGVTWTVVRGMNEIAIAASTTMTLYDYEVPGLMPVKYRARTVSEPGGVRVSSANSAPGSGLSIRLTGAGGTTISMPDSAANSITGDFEAIIKLSLDDWTPAALQQIWIKGIPYSFYISSGGGGGGALTMSGNGSSSNLVNNSTGIPGFVDGSIGWLKVGRVAATGVWTVSTSTNGVTWTVIQSNTGVAGNIFDSADPLVIGPLIGNVYYFELRNAIGGPAVVTLDAGIWMTGEVSPASHGGWTINGAAAVVGTGDPQLTPTAWWLKDPLDPTKNMTINAQPPFEFTDKEPQTIYDALGRATSVYVTDGVKGTAGNLKLWAKDKITYDKLRAITRQGRALQLQDPYGRSSYIKISSDQSWQHIQAAKMIAESTPMRSLHTLSFNFDEVAAPPVPLS